MFVSTPFSNPYSNHRQGLPNNGTPKREWRQEAKQHNPITDLFNKHLAKSVAAFAKSNASATSDAAATSDVAATSNASATSVTPKKAHTYQMKPAAIALAAVVKLKRMTMVTKTLNQDKKELLEKKDLLEGNKSKMSSDLEELKKNISAIKKVKNENAEFIKNVTKTGKMELKLLDSFRLKDEDFRMKLEILEKTVAYINAKISTYTQQISALDEQLTTIEAQLNKKEPSPISTATSTDLTTENRVPDPEELAPQPISEQKSPQIAEPNLTEPTESPSISGRITPTHSPQPLQDAAPAVKIAQPTISADTKKQLGTYLARIDKSNPLALMSNKKELASTAESLSKQMDFFTYMDQVVSDPGLKKSFQGISNQAAKAQVMFTQLQKTIQRESGTYDKPYDKNQIKSPSQRMAAISNFSEQHGLNSGKLDQLLTNVANANQKTRIAETKKLIDYMMG